MKTFTVFAVALLSAGVVFADAASADTGKTRAAVVAELAQARASGQLEALNSDSPEFFLRAPAGSVSKSRSQVVAELKQSVDSGEFAQLNSEQGSYFQVRNAATGTGKTRAEVVAELRAAQKSGELAALNSEDPMAYPRFLAAHPAKSAETLAE